MTELEIQTIAKVNQISNKFLRDLAYLLIIHSISTSRVAHFLNYQFNEEGQFEVLMDWIKSLSSEEIDQPKGTLPLGKYAESLIGFYLKNHPNYKLMAQNLQINEQQITVGELDYLFQDLVSKEYIHLEFAIKYYLKVTFQGEERFLGPSTKDWFQRKLNKLCKYQSQHTIQHAQLLPVDLQKISFQPKIMVKGALFYSYEEWSSRNNKECLTEGWWIDIEQFEKLATNKHKYQLKRSKREWVFPFYSPTRNLDYNELNVELNELLQTRNEVLVVRYSLENVALDFGFVLRKNWPN